MSSSSLSDAVRGRGTPPTATGLKILRVCAWTVIGAACAQVVTAGFGLFALDALPLAEAASLDPHRWLGYAAELLAVALLVVLPVVRPGRRTVGLVLTLFTAMLVQPVFQRYGSELPAIGALHAANALVIVVLAWLVVDSTAARIPGTVGHDQGRTSIPSVDG